MCQLDIFTFIVKKTRRISFICAVIYFQVAVKLGDK